MQPPLSTQSDAKLIKMLQHRRAAKSQATTPSNLSTSSRDTLSFSTGKGYRINTSLPRLPNLSAAQIPIGVSAAFLVSSLVDCRNQEDPTTRAAYRLLQSKGETLCGCVPQRQTVDFTADLSKHPLDPPTHPTHPITGGRITGPSRTHVAHAWDAKFEALVDCLLHDAGSDLDRRYNLDIFNAQEMESIPSAGRSTVSTDNSGEDSVESLQAIVAGVQEVLLVLDKDALCFSRLWVLTEAMMAVQKRKLRIVSTTCCLGSTAKDIQLWEERIDAIDWTLATSSRKDERRLRKFAERVWDHGIGTDRLLAQLKVALRKYIYGQIMVKEPASALSRFIDSLAIFRFHAVLWF